jgi:regulator of cell morphogenesis and NO signaling
MNAHLQNAQPEAYVLDDQQAIGHIAVQIPGATAIFRRHKLDFCCGGQVSLAQAASEKGLDVVAVMRELAVIQRTDEPVEHESPETLIDHILERYHAVHREQLPELIRMARRVEAVHRDHPLVPTGLAESPRVLRRLQTLRRLSHEQEIKSFFTGDARARCSDGAGASR